MWIADALTLARLPLAVAFWFACADRGWALAVVAAAAVTDALDGRVARRLRRARGIDPAAPARGDWLDPIVDKVFVASVIAALVARGGLSVGIAALVVARELAYAPLLVAAALGVVRTPAATERRASGLGKAATVAQLVAVGAALVAPRWSWVTAVAAGALGLLAIAGYLARSAATSDAASRRAGD